MAGILRGEALQHTLQVNGRDHAAVVPILGMVKKGDLLSVRRHAQRLDRPARLIEHVSDRILETMLPTHHVHDGELRSIG